jgi:hypothetical protein
MEAFQSGKQRKEWLVGDESHAVFGEKFLFENGTLP